MSDHDHDLEYAGKHHRHYDLERDDEHLRVLLEQCRTDLRELREEMHRRIRQLEELSPVLCTRVIMTSNGPRQCRLPVDHEPDPACPGNPHARPAPGPEASQQ